MRFIPLTKPVMEKFPQVASLQVQMDDSKRPCMIAVDDGVVVAYLQAQYSDWDSEVMGFGTATVSAIRFIKRSFDPVVAAGLLSELDTWARAQHVELLSYRLPIEDTASHEALENAGWLKIEVLVSYRYDIGETLPSYDSSLVRPCIEEDVVAAGQIAYDSFIYSRYHADPAIDNATARELKRQWIMNECRGRAELVLVAVIDGRPVGFLSMHKRTDPQGSIYASLGLLAVSPEHTGRWLGMHLINGIINHAHTDIGARYILTGTQDTNTVTKMLYERCGFRLHKKEATYHRHPGAA
jgi:GNAT superfamily N-acetyltransferase